MLNRAIPLHPLSLVKEKNRLVISKVLTISILYRLLRKLDTCVKIIGLRYYKIYSFF